MILQYRNVGNLHLLRTSKVDAEMIPGEDIGSHVGPERAKVIFHGKQNGQDEGMCLNEPLSSQGREDGPKQACVDRCSWVPMVDTPL